MSILVVLVVTKTACTNVHLQIFDLSISPLAIQKERHWFYGQPTVALSIFNFPNLIPYNGIINFHFLPFVSFSFHTGCPLVRGARQRIVASMHAPAPAETAVQAPLQG